MARPANPFPIPFLPIKWQLPSLAKHTRYTSIQLSADPNDRNGHGPGGSWLESAGQTFTRMELSFANLHEAFWE